MKVWVLDVVGYDARGGCASVYSTLENAKASRPDIEWQPDNEGWRQPDAYPGAVHDIYVIYPCEVDR